MLFVNYISKLITIKGSLRSFPFMVYNLISKNPIRKTSGKMNFFSPRVNLTWINFLFLLIFTIEHNYERLDIPMCKQSNKPSTPLHICSDVWIGVRVIILPGCKRIGKGVIIGAGQYSPKTSQTTP